LLGIKYSLRDLIVTTSIAVLQALLREKLSVYDQIVLKNLKRRKDRYQTDVLT